MAKAAMVDVDPCICTMKQNKDKLAVAIDGSSEEDQKTAMDALSHAMERYDEKAKAAKNCIPKQKKAPKAKAGIKAENKAA